MPQSCGMSQLKRKAPASLQTRQSKHKQKQPQRSRLQPQRHERLLLWRRPACPWPLSSAWCLAPPQVRPRRPRRRQKALTKRQAKNTQPANRNQMRMKQVHRTTFGSWGILATCRVQGCEAEASRQPGAQVDATEGPGLTKAHGLWPGRLRQQKEEGRRLRRKQHGVAAAFS